MPNYKFEGKVEGNEKAVLELTDQEVQTVISVFNNNAVKVVHVLKKDKGAPLCYINEANAIQCQHRHNFKYIFSLEEKDIAKHWDSVKDKFEPKKSEPKK